MTLVTMIPAFFASFRFTFDSSGFEKPVQHSPTYLRPLHFSKKFLSSGVLQLTRAASQPSALFTASSDVLGSPDAISIGNSEICLILAHDSIGRLTSSITAILWNLCINYTNKEVFLFWQFSPP